MLKRTVVATRTAVFCVALLSSPAAGEQVTFVGKTASGDPLTLTGMLTKPDGNGPFPAIVLLHGGSGIRPYQSAWAERLASWGYVALQVDSLAP